MSDSIFLFAGDEDVITVVGDSNSLLWKVPTLDSEVVKTGQYGDQQKSISGRSTSPESDSMGSHVSRATTRRPYSEAQVLRAEDNIQAAPNLSKPQHGLDAQCTRFYRRLSNDSQSESESDYVVRQHSANNADVITPPRTVAHTEPLSNSDLALKTKTANYKPHPEMDNQFVSLLYSRMEDQSEAGSDYAGRQHSVIPQRTGSFADSDITLKAKTAVMPKARMQARLSGTSDGLGLQWAKPQTAASSESETELSEIRHVAKISEPTNTAPVYDIGQDPQIVAGSKNNGKISDSTSNSDTNHEKTTPIVGHSKIHIDFLSLGLGRGKPIKRSLPSKASPLSSMPQPSASHISKSPSHSSSQAGQTSSLVVNMERGGTRPRQQLAQPSVSQADRSPSHSSSQTGETTSLGDYMETGGTCPSQPPPQPSVGMKRETRPSQQPPQPIVGVKRETHPSQLMPQPSVVMKRETHPNQPPPQPSVVMKREPHPSQPPPQPSVGVKRETHPSQPPPQPSLGVKRETHPSQPPPQPSVRHLNRSPSYTSRQAGQTTSPGDYMVKERTGLSPHMSPSSLSQGKSAICHSSSQARQTSSQGGCKMKQKTAAIAQLPNVESSSVNKALECSDKLPCIGAVLGGRGNRLVNALAKAKTVGMVRGVPLEQQVMASRSPSKADKVSSVTGAKPVLVKSSNSASGKPNKNAQDRVPQQQSINKIESHSHPAKHLKQDSKFKSAQQMKGVSDSVQRFLWSGGRAGAMLARPMPVPDKAVGRAALLLKCVNKFADHQKTIKAGQQVGKSVADMLREICPKANVTEGPAHPNHTSPKSVSLQPFSTELLKEVCPDAHINEGEVSIQNLNSLSPSATEVVPVSCRYPSVNVQSPVLTNDSSHKLAAVSPKSHSELDVTSEAPPLKLNVTPPSKLDLTREAPPLKLNVTPPLKLDLAREAPPLKLNVTSPPKLDLAREAPPLKLNVTPPLKLDFTSEAPLLKLNVASPPKLDFTSKAPPLKLNIASSPKLDLTSEASLPKLELANTSPIKLDTASTIHQEASVANPTPSTSAVTEPELESDPQIVASPIPLRQEPISDLVASTEQFEKEIPAVLEGSGGSGEVMPVLEGSGEVMPVLEGSGGSREVMPVLEGSGEVMPVLEGSGEVMSVLEGSGGSGEVMPVLEGSGAVMSVLEGSGGSGEVMSVLEGSGEVMPILEGSGEVMPVLEGSGEVMPVLEGSGGSGEVMSVLEGSGEVMPVLEDSGGSGEVMPVLEGSGGSGEVMSVLEGSGEVMSVLEGSIEVMPVLDGSGEVMPVLDGSREVMPVLEGSGEVMPVLEGSGGSGEVMPVVKTMQTGFGSLKGRLPRRALEKQKSPPQPRDRDRSPKLSCTPPGGKLKLNLSADEGTRERKITFSDSDEILRPR